MIYIVNGKEYTRKQLECECYKLCISLNYNYNANYDIKHNCERHACHILRKLGYKVEVIHSKGVN